MADAERSNEADSSLPQIPDGGLGKSMPEWLRRPPAWKTLAEEDGDTNHGVAREPLPDADTSQIDPRSLISEDDLPSWLREFGRVPGALTSVAGHSVQKSEEAVDSTGNAPDRLSARTAVEVSSDIDKPVLAEQKPDEERVSSGSQMDASLSSAPTERRRQSTGRGGWPRKMSAVAILSVLLGVAVIIIAVLLVV